MPTIIFAIHLNNWQCWPTKCSKGRWLLQLSSDLVQSFSACWKSWVGGFFLNLRITELPDSKLPEVTWYKTIMRRMAFFFLAGVDLSLEVSPSSLKPTTPWVCLGANTEGLVLLILLLWLENWSCALTYPPKASWKSRTSRCALP